MFYCIKYLLYSAVSATKNKCHEIGCMNDCPFGIFKLFFQIILMGFVSKCQNHFHRTIYLHVRRKMQRIICSQCKLQYSMAVPLKSPKLQQSKVRHITLQQTFVHGEKSNKRFLPSKYFLTPTKISRHMVPIIQSA